MKKIGIFSIAIVLLAGMLPGMTGCDGSGPDPYADYIKIYDWTDLDNIRNSLVAKYVLMNDLDSDTAGYDAVAGPTANEGKGWEPVGTSDNRFTGILDGQGYEIRNTFINRPDEDSVGFFSFVGMGGVIRDIGARDVVVIGLDAVGGLVGHNGGTLTNSYCIGNVTGETFVGCLVGYDEGNSVSNAYYNHDESLINGENLITTGALSLENFEEWLANNKFLDVSERLSFEDGYYLIESVSDFKELLAFGQNATLKFKLTNDLDLGGEPNFYIPYLAAELDGNGHIISNLSLNLSICPLGLFGYISSCGSVTGLSIENVSITGDLGAGGLVGVNIGNVSNCSVNGDLTAYAVVGGLVGCNVGNVNNCYSTCNMTGYWGIGSLAGQNRGGIVSYSYTIGSVIGWRVVGGLVGDNGDGGSVSNSLSTGNVIGCSHVGGLVGQHGGASSDVSNSYSIGNVLGVQHSGGLVGACIDGTVSNSFWDTETSGPDTSDFGTGKTTAEMQDITTFSGVTWDIIAVGDPGIRNPSHTWNIVDDETYPFLSWQSTVPVYEERDKLALLITSTDGGTIDLAEGCTNSDCAVTEPGESVFLYDEGTVVNLVATPGADYKFVQWTGDVSTIADVNSATTTITMNDNYGIWAIFRQDLEILDWYDLDAIRNNLYSDCILMNDLDSTTAGYEELASPTANGGQGWEPIGDFGGSFDGQGHEIRDLFANRPTETSVGLFQSVNTGGIIKNVGVVNVNVTGKHHVGGLVGDSEGSVSNSYATGSVTGYEAVGGLVGESGTDEGDAGSVSNSYATCSVTGDLEKIGGLVGDNKGSVSDSYATGSVTGYNIVGGLVGLNRHTVSNAYSTGTVISEEDVGGLVGSNIGDVGNSFWDTETSGQDASEGGTGKTTEEMQDISTFSGATWDIIGVAGPSIRNPSYIWNIVDDETYPFLSWE